MLDKLLEWIGDGPLIALLIFVMAVALLVYVAIIAIEG